MAFLPDDWEDEDDALLSPGRFVDAPVAVFEDEPLAPLPPAPVKPEESTYDGLIRCFPFPEIREAQEAAVRVVADAYDDPEKCFVIIDAATGSGKSGIGMAAIRWSAESENGGGHYLTSQNSLSTQLLEDNEQHGLTQIQGKSNYQCISMNADCAVASNIMKRTCQGCPYRAKKNAYIESKLGVTNYSYYMTETTHSQEIRPREILVLDEAHNIEKEVLGMVDITITPQDCTNFGIRERLPRFASDEDDKIRFWLKDVFLPKINDYIVEILEADDRTKRPNATQVMLCDKARKLQGNVELYLNALNHKEWLAWTSPDTGSLQIRPLTAADFAASYLFKGSYMVIMMSATILNFKTFRETLGIPKHLTKSIAIPSDFPKKNRRIVSWPVGSMSAKSIEASAPLIVERVIALLDKFKGNKGIIHTHNYKINEWLVAGLRKAGYGHRILTHKQNAADRLRAIGQHFMMKDEPTVLISPSMTEGLDLHGDLSRFQIIVKVPYPALDDYTKARIAIDPKWYQLQTAIALVQMSGRSVRSKDDYAVTIVLDSDFTRFITQNQDMLHPWWLDAIEFK